MKIMDDIKKKGKNEKRREDIEETEGDFFIKEADESSSPIVLDEVDDEVQPDVAAERIPQQEILKKEPTREVKVNFAKFVQLVATHNFEKVLEQKKDEEIVVSSDLLTELATAHEEVTEGDKKLPVMMIVAFIIGAALMWLVVKF